MPANTTIKYHTHIADQFVESLTEGLRTFDGITITVAANSNTVLVSANVFSDVRVDDVLLCNDESRSITNVATNGTQLTINTAFSAAITSSSFKTRDPLQTFDTYYLFVGRSTPWPSSDSSPTTPSDTVGTSTYEYARDVLGYRRVTSDNLKFIVPRYDWVSGSKYTMYDHRVDLTQCDGDTLPPFYVLTGDNEVYKCIYNGRKTSNDASIANNTSEPSTTGVERASDLISASGDNGNNYLWKYLYTISAADESKYLTASYMPVYDVSDTLNSTTGDIQDDSLASFDVFDVARTSGNGAIYQITVDDGGSEYDPVNLPVVTITGDGSGAIASAVVTGNVITAIRMTGYGENYSHAAVDITSGTSGSGASATAILSPRNTFQNTSGIFYRTNHGISIKDELLATQLMLYVELEGDEDGKISTINQYRRIGILKNPLLTTGELATANVYDGTTTLSITTGGTFNEDEIVFQPASNAYGVVVSQPTGQLKLTYISQTPFQTGQSIVGIGNGNTTVIRQLSGNVVPSSLPEIFDNIVANSGTTGTVTAVTYPSIQPFTGEILYVNHRVPVQRSNTQTEVIRTILNF